MIATDPRRDTNDLLDEEEESRPPTQRNLLANASFASSLGPDETQQDLVHGGSSLASQSGRKYSKKRAADDEAPLEEGNPFLELERDPELYKKVVVKMALQRHIYEEGHVKEQDANVSPIIRDGFFWRNYPTCEQVLYDNMREYYRVSNGQPQSKLQVSLVEEILGEACIRNSRIISLTLLSLHYLSSTTCWFVGSARQPLPPTWSSKPPFTTRSSATASVVSTKRIFKTPRKGWSPFKNIRTRTNAKQICACTSAASERGARWKKPNCKSLASVLKLLDARTNIGAHHCRVLPWTLHFLRRPTIPPLKAFIEH